MKTVIIILWAFFSFNLQAKENSLESFAQEESGEEVILHAEIEALLKKLKKALKKEKLFRQGEFVRLKRLIDEGDIELALDILGKYESNDSNDVKRLVRKLRNKLNKLKSEEDKVTKLVQPKNCLGSGLEETEFFSTERAFAAVKPDGSVVTWGHSNYGADSSAVANELVCGVIHVFATKKAFAALKTDGSVVTWGDVAYGGDSRSVASELNNVRKIYSNSSAFAAVKNDGSLVVWGERTRGGEAAIMKETADTVGWTAYPLHSSLLDGSTGRVVKIVSNDYAFAALFEHKDDPSKKSVFTWGDELRGGDAHIHYIGGTGSPNRPGEQAYSHWSKDISPLLADGVVDIVSNSDAFAAIKEDGSVVTWGDRDRGGLPGSVENKLQSDVVKVLPCSSGFNEGFVALKSSGEAVVWPDFNGIPSEELQSDVVDIVHNDISTVAIKDDGTLIIWWSYDPAGYFPSEHESGGWRPDEAEKVFASVDSYASIGLDGWVVSWGDISMGDMELELVNRGAPVEHIFSNDYAFAALKKDGSVVTWGLDSFGGNNHSALKKPYREALDTYARKVQNARDEWKVANGGREPSEQELLSWLIVKGIGEAPDESQFWHHAYRILEGAVKIASTKAAFVALMEDGSIVTWGHPNYGGDSSSVASFFARGLN